MYNVKGPSKFVAKTRRGLSQNLDTFKEHSKNSKSCYDFNNGPKPVFQNINKRINHNNNYVEPASSISPQHEEIVKYVNDSWNGVCLEFNSNTNRSVSPLGDQRSVLYFEDDPIPPALNNFQAFDLETWWANRLHSIYTT